MTNMQEDTIELSPVTAEAGPATPRTERTLAIFADPRAATLLLTETVSQLIAALNVERGLVDLSSAPGLSIAAAFELAGVPYEALQFGQTDSHCSPALVDGTAQTPDAAVDAARFRTLADGNRELSIDDFGAIDANVVLVPSAAENDSRVADFSPGTIPGVVYSQLEQRHRSVVVIDTPERGLRGLPDGSYQRVVFHVEGD